MSAYSSLDVKQVMTKEIESDIESDTRLNFLALFGFLAKKENLSIIQGLDQPTNEITPLQYMLLVIWRMYDVGDCVPQSHFQRMKPGLITKILQLLRTLLTSEDSEDFKNARIPGQIHQLMLMVMSIAQREERHKMISLMEHRLAELITTQQAIELTSIIPKLVDRKIDIIHLTIGREAGKPLELRSAGYASNCVLMVRMF
jgi:hypothetical protein